MLTFDYVAKDKKGRTVKGRLDAGDERQLITLLREQDLAIISVQEAKKRESLFRREFGSARIPIGELVLFSRQLATMIDAGIPLLQSLEILTEQAEKKALKKILTEVKDQVAAGSSFHQALARKRRSFSELIVNMVKAGEESGNLDDIMDRLAIYLEKAQRIQSKVKSAMIYPTVVSLMAVAITFLMMTVIIPVFKEMFMDLGAELPVATKVLITVSDFLTGNLIFVLGGALLFALGLYYFSRTPQGSLIVDGWKLRLPVVGMIFRKLAVSKFTRTFATLVRSGVPILDTLRIVSRTAGNRVIERAVDEVRVTIREGQSIAEPLSRSRVFPPMVVRMIAVGEKTGELEAMLTKIADFYDEQVDTAVSGLMSLIEPLIIAFLGIVIGTIVICMFLPIFSLSSAVAM